MLLRARSANPSKPLLSPLKLITAKEMALKSLLPLVAIFAMAIPARAAIMYVRSPSRSPRFRSNLPSQSYPALAALIMWSFSTPTRVLSAIPVSSTVASLLSFSADTFPCRCERTVLDSRLQHRRSSSIRPTLCVLPGLPSLGLLPGRDWRNDHHQNLWRQVLGRNEWCRCFWN